MQLPYAVGAKRQRSLDMKAHAVLPLRTLAWGLSWLRLTELANVQLVSKSWRDAAQHAEGHHVRHVQVDDFRVAEALKKGVPVTQRWLGCATRLTCDRDYMLDVDKWMAKATKILRFGLKTDYQGSSYLGWLYELDRCWTSLHLQNADVDALLVESQTAKTIKDLRIGTFVHDWDTDYSSMAFPNLLFLSIGKVYMRHARLFDHMERRFPRLTRLRLSFQTLSEDAEELAPLRQWITSVTRPVVVGLEFWLGSTLFLDAFTGTLQVDNGGKQKRPSLSGWISDKVTWRSCTFENTSAWQLSTFLNEHPRLDQLDVMYVAGFLDFLILVPDGRVERIP